MGRRVLGFTAPFILSARGRFSVQGSDGVRAPTVAGQACGSLGLLDRVRLLRQLGQPVGSEGRRGRVRPSSFERRGRVASASCDGQRCPAQLQRTRYRAAPGTSGRQRPRLVRSQTSSDATCQGWAWTGRGKGRAAQLGKRWGEDALWVGRSSTPPANRLPFPYPRPPPSPTRAPPRPPPPHPAPHHVPPLVNLACDVARQHLDRDKVAAACHTCTVRGPVRAGLRVRGPVRVTG